MFILRKLVGAFGLRPSCFLFIASLLFPAAVLAGEASGPAVSGPNGKFSVEGGQYDGESSLLALGSYTLPLGDSFGIQVDGAVGRIDDETMSGAGVHLFTRDPSKYLLGVYASYHEWNDINIWRTAAEAEVYLGRFSITGLAGFEGVDVPIPTLPPSSTVKTFVVLS